MWGIPMWRSSVETQAVGLPSAAIRLLEPAGFRPDHGASLGGKSKGFRPPTQRLEILQ